MNDIMVEWEIDSKINKSNILEETLRGPGLHQKYLDLLHKHKNKNIKLQYDLSKLKLNKYRYYRGEMSKADLDDIGWDQYQGLKPLKTDMNFILDNDPDIADIVVKIKYIENIISTLESILYQIKSRDWQIKNHIEWSKFQAGV